MDAIVSLLDEKHWGLIEALWDDLKREFGLRGIHAMRWPHFSYHVAERYDLAALEPVLARFAAGHAPFRIRTTGLGIFTGEPPVLYIPVVRAPVLSRLHAELWDAMDGTGEGVINLYHPDQLIAHITIAYGDIHNAIMPDVIRYLTGRSFTWEIPIDNITLVISAGMPDERQVRFTLAGCA